jgi:BirA family transcriptional regulator, biotin operon repressor / biotin---[acetyl-CoA-carboxylase] ligase
VIGREVIRLRTVDSTMDEAARLAVSGADEGVVVVADVQAAGRGRSGRAWLAPPGSSLLLSVLLRPAVPPERLSTLSLVAGVAVAEALEHFGGSPKLKWPNDVWLEGRKVAGVLVNTRVGPEGITAVLGIGINVTIESSGLPPGATSLSAAVGEIVPRDDLLQIVLSRLDTAYSAFTSAAGKPNLDGWTSRAALIGEHVQVSDGPELHVGKLIGIDQHGALLLRGDEGEPIRVVAGDLTRGPRTGLTNG